MAEIKRNFSASKMNKDIDERLVPPGEYRDALNVQINTSEGANVGTVQPVLGNTVMTDHVPGGGVGARADGSFCVGSIPDTKTDKIYWLVAGTEESFSPTSDGNANFPVAIKKDYVLEHNVQYNITKYVIVDIYNVETKMTNDGHDGPSSGPPDHLHISDAGDATANITGVRIGMNVTGTFINNSGAAFIAPNGNSVPAGDTYTVSILDNVVVTDIQKDTGTPSDWRIYTSKPIWHETDDVATFKSERLLNFDPSRLITGINVLDGMLFWTDNYSEPKKINIERCIAGTGGTVRLNGAPITGYQNFPPNNNTAKIIFSGDTSIFHTRLVSSKDGFTLEVMTDRRSQKAVWLKEENITTIKKGPHTPPYLEMSSTEIQRTDDNGNPNPTSSSLTNAFSDMGNVMLPGDSGSIIFDTAVDFRVGDIIMLTTNTDLSEEAFSSDLADVRIVIIDTPGFTPATGPYSYSILSINSNLGDAALNFTAKLQRSKSLFEFKFPRFAYRYKYKDGEYSTFSPFSEPAFLPGNYDYAPKKGHNLGMVNQLRSLVITDYIVEDSAKGHDVVEVDILLKHEDSPNIYTVATIKPTNDHPEWPNRAVHSSARGEYKLESELIHAAVPSNQLLRPWDNVPLKAKAQDITANRLIYGNYVQNYDVTDIPLIDVSIESTLGDLANSANNSVTNPQPTPSKSVKSLRTYQVGVVYRDKYGRETPVLTGSATSGKLPVIDVEIDQAKAFNKITAKLNSPAPEWADSYKFFVKETSNEYYSLAMDRWYEAQDGNVWLSFPSSERNKIHIHKTDRETENTFLILKKQHANNTAIETDMRYKVIDIENEAPEYIKRNTKKLGDMVNTSSIQKILETTAGFPFPDSDSFQVEYQYFVEEFMNIDNVGTTQDVGIREAMHNGYLFVKFFSGVVDSPYYKIASMTVLDTGTLKISIDGKLDGGVDFLSTDGTATGIVGGVGMRLVTQIPENKPEFDGKFFVKILNDIDVQSNIMAPTNGGSSWTTINAFQSYYVHYEMIKGAAPQAGQTHEDGPNGTGTRETGLVSDWKDGDDAIYVQYPKNPYSSLTPQEWEDLFADNAGSTYSGGGNSGNAKQATAAWWNTWGYGWFIDSAVTANEEFYPPFEGDLNSNAPNVGGSYTDIADGTHGVFDAGISGMDHGTPPVAFQPGPGTGLALSWSGIGPDDETNGLTNLAEDWSVGVGVNASQNAIVQLLETPGTQFRFADDPDENVYTIRYTSILEGRYNYDAHDDTPLWDHWPDIANKRKTWKLIVQDKNGYGIGNADGNGQSFNPTNFTYANGNWGDAGVASSSQSLRIEFVQPFSEDDIKEPVLKPAVWETEPNEDVGLDIYYEATSAIPLDLNANTNEQFAKYGSIVQNEGHDPALGGSATSGSAFSVTVWLKGWSEQTATISSSQTVYEGDIISFTAPDGGVTRLEVKTDSTATKIEFVNETYNKKVTLPYFNCYSFQNGVESNRIRDDYNEVYLKNGVKASTVLAKHYEQERRGAGMIHSGIYNSTSGTNELNQFRQAETITKDLNPRHGSIQKLINRNTDLVAITEDKCFKIMADKDMLYTADGNSQVVASNKVLGQADAFAGDYGTTNPESFAQDNFRAYFVDRTRGKVCRLSMDGITPISSAGMHDWFADNLQVGPVDKSDDGVKDQYRTVPVVLGSFDSKKSLYNVTITHKFTPVDKVSYERFENDNYTLSYSETAKGWVSFKSFYPESGLSINNDYYTFKDGEMWKHHTNETRNNFYGSQYYPDITVMFNDQPGSIKSFNTINYEGSQAKITQHGLSSTYINPVTGASSTVTGNVTDANGDSVSQQDGKYYNLNAKTGWYVESFETNEQSATVHEFLEKEGKWFNHVRGVATTHVNDVTDLSVTSSNLDQQEFSVQGIGVAATITSDGVGEDVYKFKVTNNTDTSYNPDTEIDSNTDGNPDGIWDSSPD